MKFPTKLPRKLASQGFPSTLFSWKRVPGPANCRIQWHLSAWQKTQKTKRGFSMSAITCTQEASLAMAVWHATGASHQPIGELVLSQPGAISPLLMGLGLGKQRGSCFSGKQLHMCYRTCLMFIFNQAGMTRLLTMHYAGQFSTVIGYNWPTNHGSTEHYCIKAPWIMGL